MKLLVELNLSKLKKINTSVGYLSYNNNNNNNTAYKSLFWKTTNGNERHSRGRVM